VAVLDWLQQLLGSGDALPPPTQDDSLQYLQSVLAGQQAAPGGSYRTFAEQPRPTQDVGTGIPLDPRSPVQNPQQASALDDLMAAIGGVGTFGAGLAERANKGALNALGFRAPGGDIYRADIPVDEGMRMLEGGLTAATGGLTSSLFPAAGMLRAGGQYAGQLGGATAREAATAVPGLLADEAGALRLTPRQLKQQTITLDTPLASAPEDVIPTPLVSNTPPPKFPQYAEAYPAVGTPVPQVDKTSGKPYLGKGETPEMLAFGEERLRIADDMKKSGFTPYFDPALRSDVNPSYYPANIDTASIVPKTQAKIDEHLAVIGSDEARARLQAAYQRGSEMPNTEKWYAMKQLEDEFIKELGPVAGREAFQNRFATSMAATTGGAAPEGNFLMAMYGNYLRNHGLPYPEAAYEMPYPIGGRFATGNMQQHQKIFDAGGFSSLGEANPKRHDFSQAFTGNPNVVTMDEQMTSGMVPGLTIPKWYGLHEQVAREEAAKAGVSPREFQGTGWSGFKNLKTPKYTEGQPMIQVVNESIERTHRLTGMPREEIVRRGIINGEIPLYGLLGAVGLGAAADQ
jgi:hypothetical protein